MHEVKNWWQSKTIWGALVAVVASLLGAFGITPEIGQQEEITDALIQLAGALGALFAVFGRLSANSVIN